MDKKFYFCLNCRAYKILNNNNPVRYFTNLNLVIAFISASFGSSSQAKTIVSERLIYFGLKEKINYYLLSGINRPDIGSLLKKVQSDYTCYIFHLENFRNTYNLKIPRKIKLYNLSECLVFSNATLQLLLPKLFDKVEVARLGGIACSEKKFGKARRFVRELFKQKNSLKPRVKKKEICLEIYNELIKRPDLIVNLSEDNLFDWITKQTRNLK